MESRIMVQILCVIGILLASGSTNSVGASTAPSNAAASPQVSEYNISFSITKTFKELYNNMSDPETKSLMHNITSEVEPFFKKAFPNFRRLIIRAFRNGSIVTDGALEFNASNSNPNISQVTKVLGDAIASGNLTINININSTIVTAPVVNTVPTTAPIPTTSFTFTFSILSNFTAALSNMSSPEAVNLTSKITNEVEPIFKKGFKNFIRMLIKKFSNGSIVTEGSLEFNKNETVPKLQDLAQFFVNATSNGNFSFKVDPTSFNITDSSGSSVNTVPTTAPIPTTSFTFTFSILSNFTAALSNMSSPEAVNLTSKITNEVEPAFKKDFKNFIRMLIKKFSNGSIVTEGSLHFINNDTIPNVKQLVQYFANDNFSFKIDPKSIKVTDSLGNSAFNASPVFSSMFSVLWMTLASLLLSVMMQL